MSRNQPTKRDWFVAICVMAVCFPAVCQAERTLPVTRLSADQWPMSTATAIAADPGRRKIYIGVRSEERNNLLVVDMDDSGQPTGEPRAYLDSPDPLPDTYQSIIKQIVPDPRGKRLFLLIAISGPASVEYRPLVTYLLNDQGEPHGSPEAFSIGNPAHACDALAFHPTLPVLYAVGWGGGGVARFDVDSGGRPTAPAAWHTVGGIGKMSVAVHPEGGKLYCGSFPGLLEVCDLDPAGAVTGERRTYALPDPFQGYLDVVATNHHVFLDYIGNEPDALRCMKLNTQGEPVGEAMILHDIKVDRIAASPLANHVLAATRTTFDDALTGEMRVSGVQVVQIGESGKAIRIGVRARSEEIANAAMVAFSRYGAPVVATRDRSHQFLGNRYAGLRVRLTPTHVEATTALPPATHTAAMPGEAGYLRFVHAPRYKRVYAASSSGIGHFTPGSESRQFEITPQANLTGPVAIDETIGVLYLAAASGRVIAQSLNDAGDPTGTTHIYETGLTDINALVTHPGKPRVYALGPGSANASMPGPVIAIAHASVVSEAVVSPDVGRLYAVTQHAKGSNLWIWTLDPDGRLLSEEPRQYDDGLPSPQQGNPSLAMTLALAPQRRLLFVGGGAQAAPPPSVGIAVHTLDKHGDPTGNPQFYPTRNPNNSTWSLTTSPDQNRIYETGWGTPAITRWNIDPAGQLEPEHESFVVGQMGKRTIAYTSNGEFLLAGTNPGTLEVIAMTPAGTYVPGIAIQLANESYGPLRVGQPSAWFNLDHLLKDDVGIKVIRGSIDGCTVSRATLQMEFATRESQPIKTVKEDYVGNRFAFLAPAYGNPGMTSTTDLATQIQSVPQRYRQYMKVAEQYTVSPEDRPKQFLIANGLISIDDSIGSLDAGLSLLQTLGHNTVEIWHWGNLAPDALRRKAGEFGFQQFRMSVYKPPAYFDYVRDKVSPAFLDQWAGSAHIAGKGLANMGASGGEVKLFHLADEPGWYYPYVIDEVTSNPAYLAVFHEYLQSNSLTAEFFGKRNWDEVVPIRLSQVTDLYTRRLLHWTARFYAESFSRNLRAASDALQRRFHDKLYTTINLNNWPGQFFLPSPNIKIGNNTDIGPDAAMGMPNWFDLGRKRAATCFWTEDWFIDAEAQVWSVYGDLMRCAAREGDMEMGAYVVGRTTWQVPDGGAYKVLSLVGHGTKVFDFYTFGPEPAFSDGWSENEPSYQSIAQAIRLLGRGEKLLHPGRPRNGTVAILFPQASQVWDTPPLQHSYMTELYGLHAALVHEQFPVDFIDDVGVEAGDLDRYRYHTLYVTAPNLSLKAQRAIVKWVAEGGTLVVMPGAAAADEYNDHADALSSILGATRAQMVREPWPTAQQQRLVSPTIVAASDPRLGTFTIPVHGPLAALNASAKASVLAHADERPIVVKAPHGRGHVFSYACWPGNVYWNSPDRSDRNRLPRNWSDGARQLVTAPARMHGAPKWVYVDHAGVEACLLESPNGIAITLLNWTGEPLGNIEVTIPGVASVGHARSIQSGPLTASQSPDGLKLTLPLATVDVLLLEP